MPIKSSDLEAATKAGIISRDQATKLKEFWLKESEDVPSFKMTHVLYYFGGLLSIAAISVFTVQAWDTLFGLPLFILSSLLFILGLLFTHYLLQRNHRLPAGLMATFSLVVVPLAVYNLQSWLGYTPGFSHYADYHYYVSWSWMPMELATLIAGVIMFYLYRFPFLLFPISVTLWYMSMDFFPLLMSSPSLTWEGRAMFSMWFGLIILLIAFYMDIKYSDEKQDYAFWLYLFGVLTFWGGLSCQHSDSEISKFIYCLINLGLILISVFLNRRVFAVFGAIGVFGYLGYLSFNVFSNSLGFPILLVFLGILIILLGTRWSRIENKLYQHFRPFMPAAILERKEKS